MPSGKLTNMSLWSTTAASNATVGSITWAEGQAPSTVNDSSRQEMADIRSWYETAQWIDFGYSISYVSTTVFKYHDADRRTTADANRRVRAGVGAGTIYGTISDVTFSTSDTQVTVTWDSGNLDASLSYVALGILSGSSSALPTPRPSLILLTTGSATNTAAVDVVGLPSTYDEYLFVVTDLIPQTDNTDLWIRVSEDSGGTFKSGASDYAWEQNNVAAGANSASNSTGDTKIKAAAGLGNGSGKSFSCEVNLWNPAGTSKNKNFLIDSSYIGSAANVRGTTAGFFILDTNAISAVRFMMSSGNITSGNFAVYGMRKS